ncbi:unnamed protein product [Calicophoron daubneyi]|uniref:Spindle assembly abnormal protein 6 N-terminal domain-containing protein n=1 Tax=Calicophoron daubneyi TaxID=300641 RepID=A0AAV2TGD5_CALDB
MELKDIEGLTYVIVVLFTSGVSSAARRAMGYIKRHLVNFEEADVPRRKRFVNVTFENELLGSGDSSKGLLVRLSDDDDLYFLYSTHITESDFDSIKRQQGLLVDFSGFGQKVVDLLELCLKEEVESNPKYTLKFSSSNESGVGVLRIVEATNFKYLTHLSLNLRAGDDEALKSYLVNQLKQLRVKTGSEINELKASLYATADSLSNSEKALSSLKREFETFKSENCLRSENLKNSHEKAVLELTQKLEKAKDDYEKQISEERKRSQEKLEKVTADFEASLLCLRQENEGFRVERSQLQSRINQLTSQTETQNYQNTTLKKELSSARTQITTAEEKNQVQVDTINKMELRIGSLVAELSTKDNLISKTQEMLVTEQEQKSRYQEEVQRQSRQVEKLEMGVKKHCEEISKANEIIKRLQSEVKSHHTKAKLRGQVAAEQERLLSSKESDLSVAQSEVQRLRTELESSQAMVTTLEEQLKRASEQLSEAQKTIKTNENIITWLNRQISENQIGQVQQRLKASGLSGSTTTTGSIFGTRSSASVAGLASTLLAPPGINGWHPAGSNTLPYATESSRVGAPFSGSTAGLLPAPSGTNKNNSCPSKPVTTASLMPRNNYTSDPLPRTTGNQVSLFNATSPRNNNLQPNSHLPCYMPSKIAEELRGPAGSDQLNGSTRFVVPQSESTQDPDDESRSPHQRSLTSAYFPKPLGIDSRR